MWLLLQPQTQIWQINQNHQSWAYNPWKTLVHRNLISILILIQNESILRDDNYKKSLFHLEHSKNYNMHFTTQVFKYLYCMQHVITGFHYQIPFQKLRKFLNSEIPYCNEELIFRKFLVKTLKSEQISYSILVKVEKSWLCLEKTCTV